MKNSGNPLVPLQVKSYQAGLFRLAAALKIDSSYLPEKVLEQGEQQLRDTFSFAARGFGQPVHLSEVIAVLQNVAGVVAVNVTALYRSNEAAALKGTHRGGGPASGQDPGVSGRDPYARFAAA